MNSPIRNIGILISTALLLLMSNSSSVATEPRTNCNIRLDNPHLSAALQRTKGVVAVKVNARSKCDKAMQNLVLTVEIYKVGFLRNELVRREKREVLGYIPPNKIIKNYRTFKQCISSRMSKYFGKAYATALIDCRTYATPAVWSAKTIALPCGT